VCIVYKLRKPLVAERPLAALSEYRWVKHDWFSDMNELVWLLLFLLLLLLLLAQGQWCCNNCSMQCRKCGICLELRKLFVLCPLIRRQGIPLTSDTFPVRRRNRIQQTRTHNSGFSITPGSHPVIHLLAALARADFGAVWLLSFDFGFRIGCGLGGSLLHASCMHLGLPVDVPSREKFELG
jgi:hypothetical protein